MKFVLFLLAMLPSVLFSFTPGKWSHLDEYVLTGKPGGPDSEIVKDAGGKVIYQASYQYDEKGHLLKEEYRDDSGKPDGYTIFKYEKDRVVSEVLYDAKNKVREKKAFQYNGNKLEKVILYNEDGTPELVCTIFKMNGSIVTDAETKWGKAEDSEKFSMVPDKTNSSIWRQAIINNQNEKVGEVVYYFDAGKRLVKRENFIQGQPRKNELVYGAGGRLEQFSFHVKQEKGWVLLKTHFLNYNKGSKTLIN